MVGDEALLDALEARSGLVCFVGAGGKKTTLYRLATIHPGRVGITATVHIPIFPKTLEAAHVIAPGDELVPAILAALSHDEKIAFAYPSDKRGRFAGLDPLLITRVQAEAGFDVVLVKADGARSRWIKAPNEVEPQIPNNATTVIPVVSARAIGEKLSERIAHRLERIESICGVRSGQPITPLHVARLLADKQGGVRGSGKARVIPLINMVDDEERKALAVEVAEHALRLSNRFDRVVLTSMRRDDPLVDVIGQ